MTGVGVPSRDIVPFFFNNKLPKSHKFIYHTLLSNFVDFLNIEIVILKNCINGNTQHKIYAV